MGLIAVVLVLGLGLAQLFLGFMGLDYLFGLWAAFLGIALVFMFRVFLPMTIGAWFGAVEVMGWPWWAGVMIVAPGLLFIVPAMVTGLFAKLRTQAF